QLGSAVRYPSHLGHKKATLSEPLAAVAWLGGNITWNQADHSASKESCPPGREQSCVWWPRRHESGRHALSDRSAPLREESRYLLWEYKALPHCLRYGHAPDNAPTGVAF